MAPEDTEEIPSVTLEQLGIESVDEDESNILRLSLLQGVLRLLTQYLQLYASTPALVEVFGPLHSIITQMLTVSWHKDIEVKEIIIKYTKRLGKKGWETLILMIYYLFSSQIRNY